LGKVADYQGWVDTLNQRVRRKSMLFLISDFIGDINLTILG